MPNAKECEFLTKSKSCRSLNRSIMVKPETFVSYQVSRGKLKITSGELHWPLLRGAWSRIAEDLTPRKRKDKQRRNGRMGLSVKTSCRTPHNNQDSPECGVL